MDKTLNRIFSIVSIILIVAATAYQVAVLYQGDSAMKANTDTSNSILDGFFYVTYIALALTVVFAILFPVFQMISNPKGALTTLVVLGIAVVLWFVALGLADNTFTARQLETMEITEYTSKLVGAGLIYTYFVFGLAVLAIIYASISSIFK